MAVSTDTPRAEWVVETAPLPVLEVVPLGQGWGPLTGDFALPLFRQYLLCSQRISHSCACPSPALQHTPCSKAEAWSVGLEQHLGVRDGALLLLPARVLVSPGLSQPCKLTGRGKLPLYSWPHNLIASQFVAGLVMTGGFGVGCSVRTS